MGKNTVNKEPETYRFPGTIEVIKGVFRNYGIYLPADLLAKMPAGRARAQGTMNSTPFNLGIISAKEAGKFFTISAPFLKTLKAKPGDTLDISFQLVSYELIDIPEELMAALELEPEAQEMFNAFTPGVKRNVVHYVNGAKLTETRIKRALEMTDKIKNRRLSVQQRKK